MGRESLEVFKRSIEMARGLCIGSPEHNEGDLRGCTKYLGYPTVIKRVKTHLQPSVNLMEFPSPEEGFLCS